MFGGEFLTSFFPEAGFKNEWKNIGEIHYEKSSMNNILFIEKNLLD